MLVWQGAVSLPPRAEIAVELWAAGPQPKLAALAAVALEFVGYVDLDVVPLRWVCGPELSVYSSAKETRTLFGQLAAARAGLVLRCAGAARLPGRALLFYFSGGQVFARLVDIERDARPREAAPAEPSGSAERIQEVATGAPAVATAVNANAEAGPVAAAAPESERITRALQHVVLSAMRLRGVTRESADYKQMYHAVLLAAKFALRGRTPAVHEIRDKVEEILNVLA